MRRLWMVSIGLGALLAAGWVVLARVAPRVVARPLARATGLDVVVGGVRIDWATGRVSLHDVTARSRDGEAVVRVRALVVGIGALRGGATSVLDGAVARGAALLDLPETDGRARRLRVSATGDVIAVDGVFESGSAVAAIVEGRIDATKRTVMARRVGLAGARLEGRPTAWAVAVDRVTATAVRVGDAVVERLVADGVGLDAAPARLRARVRIADGTARVRWNAAEPRLDVRLIDVPLRGLAANPFRDATLSGGLTRGVVHLGRIPGALDARVRVGPTRLVRGGETWLGWDGLTVKVRRFDVRSRRLLGAALAVTAPVAIVHRTAVGFWPVSGWDEWIAPMGALAIGAGWTTVVEHFGRDERDDVATDATLSMTNGAVTVVDATRDMPVRLAARDLDARVAYAPTRGVEGTVSGRVGDEGRVAAALMLEPLPRATLDVRGLPIRALGGWSDTGRELLGVPLGRALALAGADPTLDLAVDVSGDPGEKRFGLATKALGSLVETLRDRVTTPLLASTETRLEDGVESLVLPIVAVETAGTLAGPALDVADRVAVLLRSFPELSVRLDGRFAADESTMRGEERAAAMKRHLTALGVGDRVVVGPVATGPPGVEVVIGAGAS